MKSKFTRPAAFAAAALLIIGVCTPAFAVMAEGNQDEAGDPQNAFEYISDKWNRFYKKHFTPPDFIPLASHGTYEVPPYWDAEMVMNQDKPVDKYQVQPDEYYIYKTEDGYFNTIYSLIKIHEVYEEGGIFGYGTTRTANYSQENVPNSGKINLDQACLYEVLPSNVEADHPDLLFTYEGRCYPCDKYGIPNWNDSMWEDLPIDQFSVEPGRYYIYRTYDREHNEVYSLIRIDEVYEKDNDRGPLSDRIAKFTSVHGGGSGVIPLNRVRLYEVPFFASNEDRGELPNWDESMCTELVDPFDLQLGRYYICMNYNSIRNKVYRLVKVTHVYDRNLLTPFLADKYAKIEFPETGISRIISLGDDDYPTLYDKYYFYEIPDQTSAVQTF